MKKEEIIKKNNEFSKVIKEGKYIRNKYYSIYYLKLNDDKNLYGISIPTKTGKAVIRNKLKRQVKNIIDNNKKYIQNTYEYVIIIKKNILELTYYEKEKQLVELFDRIGDGI